LLLGAAFAFPRPSAAAPADLYPRLGCAAGGAVAAAVLLRRPAPEPAPTPPLPAADAAKVRILAFAFFAALAAATAAAARAARVARDAVARADRSEFGLENAAKTLRSTLMDLEVLRLALEDAEANVAAEREARVALETKRKSETARAQSETETIAARDASDGEIDASDAASAAASSLVFALEDERGARADLERRVEEMRVALATASSRLADAESRLARASTERDVALRRAATATAPRSRPSSGAEASIARDAPDMPVRFELRGIPEVEPGYRVVVAGTWCDWDLSLAAPMSLELEDGDDGATRDARRYWAADIEIHADDTYEYKYAVTRADGSGTEDARWQPGNNRTLALQFSLARDVALVEVEDRWRPDPKASPILLHHLDGTIEEIGSTQLLRDCISELRATVRRLGDAATAADAAAAEEEARVTDAIVAERAAAAAVSAAENPTVAASEAAVAKAEEVREERLAVADVAAEFETAELEATELEAAEAARAKASTAAAEAASAMAAAEARRLRGESKAPSPR
jgi:hypothetical protein